MFKLMGKEINAILGAQTILIWAYDTNNLVLHAQINNLKWMINGLIRQQS